MKKIIVEFINNIKTNKRYRAIFILGLYFIFFSVVIVSLTQGTNKYNEKKPNGNKKKEPVEVLQKYNSLSNYKFEIEINFTEGEELLIYQFTGEVNDKRTSLVDVGDNQYLFENDTLFIQLGDVKEEVNNSNIKSIYKYTPNYIYNLIKLSDLELKTENFNEKTMAKKYKLDVRKIEGFENHDETYLLITTIENDKKIKEVDISFESQEKEKVDFSNIRKINISYLDE